jgi:uncharacterized membrane protein YdjX (TVP38/TMEM64 family)
MATLLRIAGIATPLIFGIFLGRLVAPWLPDFTAWVATMGLWAPLAYVLAYIAVVVLMLPAFLLIMAGGAVFGTVLGTTLAMAGAMIGGIAAFLIARHLARARVANRVAKNATLAAIDRSIGEDGMRLIFLLRLSPAIPFVLSNYALGVTRVRFSHFVVGTLGLVPIVLTFAAFGSASGAGPRPDGSPPIPPAVLVLGIGATVLLGLLLTRITQRAMRSAPATEALNTVSQPPLP